MSANSLKSQGDRAFASKDFQKAIDLFSKAIKKAPKDHMLYSNRSASFLALKKYKKALNDAIKTIHYKPTWSRGYVRLGAATFCLGELDEAEESYYHALRIDPSNKQAQEGLKKVQEAKSPSVELDFFDNPNLIKKLQNNPEVSDHMKDPTMIEKVKKMAACFKELYDDPRLMEILGVMFDIGPALVCLLSNQFESIASKKHNSIPTAAAITTPTTSKSNDGTISTTASTSTITTASSISNSSQSQTESLNKVSKTQPNNEKTSKDEDGGDIKVGEASEVKSTSTLKNEKTDSLFDQLLYSKEVEKRLIEPTAQAGTSEDEGRGFVSNIGNVQAEIEESNKKFSESQKAEKFKDDKSKVNEISKNDQVRADQAKAEGNTLYKARKFDEAISKYTKAFEIYPDITYLNNKAAAEFEKGDYDATLATCEIALEKGRAQNADAKLIAKSFARIGTTLLKLNKINDAIDFFEKSLAKHKTPNVEAKLKNAQELFEKSGESIFEFVESSRKKALDFFENEDYKNAIKEFTKVLKYVPGDPKALSGRAIAYTEVDLYDEAIKDSETAIEIDPSFIQGYLLISGCQVDMNKLDDAMETLKTAKAKDCLLNQGSNQERIDQVYNFVHTLATGETPEAATEEVLEDPQVASILEDPQFTAILYQGSTDINVIFEHIQNDPEFARKAEILRKAGIITSF